MLTAISENALLAQNAESYFVKVLCLDSRDITHGSRKGTQQLLKVKNSFWVYGFEIYKKLKNGVMGRQVAEYPTPCGP